MYLNLDQLTPLMSAPSSDHICTACNLELCACATSDFCDGCGGTFSDCSCTVNQYILDDYFPTACRGCGQMDLACECIDLRTASIL